MTTIKPDGPASLRVDDLETLAAGRAETGSLRRGLALMELLQAAQWPMTATELADATRQPLSTVHRLVQTLIQSEYVYRDASKRYFAGPKALMPLNLYHPLNALRRDVREHLRALREQFRHTTSCIVFLGVERLVVELAVENESLSPYHATHLKSPLHGAASGKVLLASLSRAERSALLQRAPLVKCTPYTITDFDALESELDLVRSRGFAVAIDENHVGLSAAAAPIYGSPGQVIGCLVLAGLSSSLSRDSVNAAGQVLKMTADLFFVGSMAVRAVGSWLGRGAADFGGGHPNGTNGD